MMCDAGCLAMSKEVGPEKGLGRVLDLDGDAGDADGWGETGWRLGRVSQEHGILVRDEERIGAKEALPIGRDGLEVGVKVRIVPVSPSLYIRVVCGVGKEQGHATLYAIC